MRSIQRTVKRLKLIKTNRDFFCMKAYKLTILTKRHKPLCRIKERVLTYHLGAIYSFDAKTRIKNKLVVLPASKIMLLMGRFRIFERIFRLEPRTAVELQDDEVLVSHFGAIYRINTNTKTIYCEHKYRKGMNNPLTLTKIEGIKGFDDCIVYGEYFGNKSKDAVAIYARSISKNEWDKVFEFPQNTINHIHAILPDPYREGVIILTGDDNEGSGIWLAKKGFKEVVPILTGSQKYRSCCAFPIQDGILYATDTPIEQNYIILAKETNDGWETQKISDLKGSCIYCAQIGEIYIFSSTVEPDSRQNGLRYLLSYRLGAGIEGWNSQLIAGTVREGFKSIASFRKDLFPMTLCQFGSVIFCSGRNEHEVFAYPVSVFSYDSRMIKIELR